MLLLKGHKKAIHEIAFSPDGMRLISAGRDGTVRIWDLFAGKQVANLTHTMCVTTVAFASDSRLAAVGGTDHKVLLWDTSVDKVVAKFDLQSVGDFSPSPGRIDSLAFSPSDRHLVVSGSKGLACWKRKSDSWQFAWFRPEACGCLTHSPNGKSFVTGSAIDIYANRANALDFWQTSSGKVGKNVPSRGPYWTNRITSLAYSPDGTMVAGTCGRELVVWSVKTLSEGFSYKTTGKFMQSVAFSPEGKVLAAVSNDEIVQTWNTADWTPRDTFSWAIGKLLDVAFSPDGMRMAACGSTGKIIVWDVF